MIVSRISSCLRLRSAQATPGGARRTEEKPTAPRPSFTAPAAAGSKPPPRLSANRSTLRGSSWTPLLLLGLLLPQLVFPRAGGAAESTAPAAAFRSIYLSEFLADNQHGLADEDGDHPGWVEIHNGSLSPVSLRGWFLTDSPTNLTRWRFPGVAILPDRNLVVFASGKNRVKDLVHLHTSFRLDPRGSRLLLVDPATNIISQFAAAPQRADVSQGRVRGEPAWVGYFARPTPGRPNATSGAGFGPEVSFSVTSRNFTEPFRVALRTAPAAGTNGAVTIRYTLDGTLPSSRAVAYTGPLEVTNTLQVRARAFQEGQLPGPPQSETYLRLFTNAVTFTSTLPILVMDTFGKEVPITSHSSFVHLSLHEPVGGRASLTNPPSLATRGGFRVRGSTSAGMPQSGFSVQLLDEFNEEKAQALAGLPADSDWILYAPNGYDPVLIHNPFVHQLSRDMGRYSPRTRFVEVFVVSGPGRLREAHYNGLYVLEEKVKIGKHRVDIDRLGAEDLKPPQVTGGYLVKFDRLGPGEGGFSTGGPTMAYVEPKEQTLSLPQRAPQMDYLTAYLTEFERALNGPHWKDPEKGYRAYLDVPAAIDFHVLEVLSGNVDAIVLSTYFHKPRNGKIICGPHWDYDRALGSTDGRDDNPRNWNTGPFFGGAWWPRLFSDPDFWQLWVDRWQELRRSHFSVTHLNQLADRLAEEIGEAQPRQYRKWGFQPRGGTYQAELEHMKEWLADRVSYIDDQLAPVPLLGRAPGPSQPGATLTLTVPKLVATNAVIYYTLDGSDPRRPQGSVSSNAIPYTGPITVNGAGRIRLMARTRDPGRRQVDGPPRSTPWSGPVRAEFEIK